MRKASDRYLQPFSTHRFKLNIFVACDGARRALGPQPFEHLLYIIYICRVNNISSQPSWCEYEPFICEIQDCILFSNAYLLDSYND